MINCNLDNSWVRVGNSWAKGYAFYEDRLYMAHELASIFDDCATKDSWLNMLLGLNGSYALVTLNGNQLQAAVDRLRTIPLFYALRGEELYLSDDAYWIQETVDCELPDEISILEFYLTGYVTAYNTLYQDLKQLRACELLYFEMVGGKACIETHRYYSFRHDDFMQCDDDTLIQSLLKVHQTVFDRLVRSLNGRQAIIPLSGGYDSRLIGISLKEAGLDDVVCYTYGVPDNWESRISKELADYLGYRWVFIPYSPERWRQWAAAPEFERYFRYAGNLSSVPHVQDWPAVLELKKNGDISANGVFIPGHSGDFLAGSHIPKWYINEHHISRRQVLDSLYQTHYNLWDWPIDHRTLEPILDSRIEKVIGDIHECNPEDAADLFEWWDFQERQAKFICNSLRVYDFFGYEWRLPLFDHDLMDFWARVRVENRTERRLYFEFVKRHQQLPIREPNTDRGIVLGSVINMVDKLHLRPFTKAVQRRFKRVRWEKEYRDSADPPMAWFGMLDRELFKRTYTGKETMHSYLARRYLETVLPRDATLLYTGACRRT